MLVPMKTMAKRVLYPVLGVRMTGYLRLYSPTSYVQAIVARRRYDDYYAAARRAYRGTSRPNEHLVSDGIDFFKAGVSIPTDLREAVESELNSGDCVSYRGGFYKPGIDTSAEYTYLSKPAVKRLRLAELALGSGLIGKIEEHLGSYARIVNLVVFKTYPMTHTKLGSFQWHRDNQPKNSYKLITYFTEVGPEDGPFTYALETHRSYNGLPQFGNSRLDHQPERSHTYLGSPGDTVAFDINGFHQGGTSRAHHRIVMVCHLKPSVIPADEHYRQFGVGGVSEPEYGPDPSRVWWKN